MKQESFSDMEYRSRKKKTKREEFLEIMDEIIPDRYSMRKFMGINFFEQDVPDATTLPHFRHLLEEKGIGKLFLTQSTAAWKGLDG